MRQIRLSDAAGRDSNLDLVRLIAASLVIFSHSYPLTGHAEPLKALTGTTTFGTLAVDIFFITSGYLVTGSLASRGSLIDFIASRVLRVYPGLIVMTLLTIAAIGVLAPAGFFFAPETLAYLRANALIGLRQLTLTGLPGVFPDNPMPEVVNGSLWTLPFELRMYAALGVLWLGLRLAGLRRFALFRVAIVAIAVLSGVARFIAPENMMIRCLFMFFTGGAASVFRSRVVIDGRIAVACVTGVVITATLSHAAFFVAYNLCLAYILAAFAFLPRLWRPAYDYSYGVYIYAFPVQQAVVALFPHWTPLQVTLASFPPIVLLAAMSWHIVESRGMALKSLFRRKRASSADFHRAPSAE